MITQRPTMFYNKSINFYVQIFYMLWLNFFIHIMSSSRRFLNPPNTKPISFTFFCLNVKSFLFVFILQCLCLLSKTKEELYFLILKIYFKTFHILFYVINPSKDLKLRIDPYEDFSYGNFKSSNIKDRVTKIHILSISYNLCWDNFSFYFF